jgi:hypothetical protein
VPLKFHRVGHVVPWSRHLARVHLVPVPSWARRSKIFPWESVEGQPRGTPSRASRALGLARQRGLAEIRALCHDGPTVEQLRKRTGYTRSDLLVALQLLWFGNGLTWVPPARKPP